MRAVELAAGVVKPACAADPGRSPSIRSQWVVLGAIILPTLLIRIRLLSFPLERDEGAFAYMAQLLLQGIPPYTQAYDFKPPGLYVMYALFIAVFGESAVGIHLGLLVMNVASIVLLFFIAKRLLDVAGALAASASFAALSLGPSVLGFAAHATQFVLLPALAGMLLLMVAMENGHLSTTFWSGALLGAAFLMKQSGMFFVAFGFVMVLYGCLRSGPTHWRIPVLRTLVFAAGALAPILLAALLLWLTNAFEKFWFWCFVYTSRYGSALSAAEGVHVLWAVLPKRVGGYYVLWAMAVAGVVATFLYAPIRRFRVFLLVFAAMSFGAVCPGFYFRGHYFIVLLPAIALLSAVTVRHLDQVFAGTGLPGLRWVPTLLLTIAIAIGLATRPDYYFTSSPTALARTAYGANPFPEAVAIAKVIEARSDPNDRIAVFGSEPELYFYSGRKAASNFIFTYPLVEKHEFERTMQEEMISAVEAVRPKYLIVVNVPTSWMARPDSQPLIFEWLAKYSRQYYQIAGIVEIRPTGTGYYWDERARAHSPPSALSLIVYERTTA